MLFAQIPTTLPTNVIPVEIGSAWTPTTVVLVVIVTMFALTQMAVTIIKTLRGDPSSLKNEQMLTNLFNALQGTNSQLTQLAKDTLPPSVTNEMLKVFTQAKTVVDDMGTIGGSNTPPK